MTNTTLTHRASLSLIRRRAKRTDLVGVDADGLVVLAEDDAGDVVCYVFGADVGVKRYVRGTFEVVGVLVETHVFFRVWFAGLVGLVVFGGFWWGYGARLVVVFDRCRDIEQVIDG